MILLAATLAMAVPRTIFADGAWASFDRGVRCDAATRAERTATERTVQAHAAFLFADGASQFAARLSRSPDPGATVVLTVGEQSFLLVATNGFAWSRGPAQEAAIIAAARTNGSMRVEARAQRGGRFIDRYSLDGAPGALDAAAACAARR